MKKELIDRLGKLRLVKHLYLHDDEISCLEDTITFLEELPDFQRIDEERMREVFMKHPNSRHIKYDNSFIVRLIKEYNSTLPSALVPLPKEMPDEFRMIDHDKTPVGVWAWIVQHYGTPANNLQPLPGVMPALWHDAFTDLLHKRMQPSEFYSLIRKTYGTPDKPNLPSVEELAKEITVVFNQDSYDMMRSIAQHLHDKYSLHPREWWKDAIPYSTQFKYNDTVYTFSEYSYESSTQKTWIHNTGGGKILCSHCTPYTPPTADDIIKKHNLSEEEVKILREGKCT